MIHEIECKKDLSFAVEGDYPERIDELYARVSPSVRRTRARLVALHYRPMCRLPARTRRSSRGMLRNSSERSCLYAVIYVYLYREGRDEPLQNGSYAAFLNVPLCMCVYAGGARVSWCAPCTAHTMISAPKRRALVPLLLHRTAQTVSHIYIYIYIYIYMRVPYLSCICIYTRKNEPRVYVCAIAARN
uniref:Uncharacterized protein n=1 Tax=Trichogramma kaykai TaxID=54128 RepID=A0ABD2XJK6_9HYME